MLDVYCVPRGVTSTKQWSRPETNVFWETTCRHAVRIAVAVCCAEVLFQRSTLRITGRDTAQTERILMRLVDT